MTTNYSKEYEQALIESRKASQEFSVVQNLYRSQKCSDEAYLEARKIYKLSEQAFDRAFEKEQSK